MKKLNIVGILGLAAALLAGCNQVDFNPIPQSQLLGDSIPTTFTIAQLRASFTTNRDAYSDTTNSNGGLYTANLIDTTKEVVISGYITSSDVEGNIYKNIVIQEKNGQAMKISINAGSLSGIYPLGKHVWFRCNGLYLGKYGEAAQIGTNYTNTTKMIIKKSTNDTIYRTEPGRIPLPIAQAHIHAYGLPDPTIIKADTMTISQIRAISIDKRDTLINKLVCIKNAYFTGASAGVSLSGSDLIFAPSTNGAGYPQSRDITDGTGTIVIATSEFAKFAQYALPSSMYRGNITVIVGWYRNYMDTSGDWQLTLRGMFDLGKGYEGYHTQINK